ncbi:MAG TPA: metallophosphoesterase [Candidatus Avacidaminococcus intestinavium]|uniref:Metallophosphoesterase n=1 Tax=Candidatus Avacidaminococcus intestinavium TaxID=2840684 RepID=A0A9D1MQF0_9FIRM|nr:metallophosphoesterase [Candidatus Avacidaminococcus intestinavium]
MNIIFIFIYLIASLLVFLFYHRAFGIFSSKKLFYSWLVCTTIFFSVRFLDNIISDTLLKWLSYFSGIWMFFIYYSILFFILKVLIDLVKSLITGKISITNGTLLAKICCFVIVSGIIYGSYEAYTPIVRTEEIKTKKITEPLNIIFVSDIHSGNILGKEFVAKLVNQINTLNPDFVLIGGDIIDHGYEVVARQNSLLPLKNISVTYGTIAVLGNHDYLTHHEDLLTKELTKLGLTVLINKKIERANITFVGLKDYSKDSSLESLQDLYDIENKNYKVLLDHQPHRISAAAKSGYDLYLAGHTHSGAFFPNQLLTTFFNDMNYGRQSFENLVAIVTSGYGFFGIPIRINAQPEIVLIKLIPDN